MKESSANLTKHRLAGDNLNTDYIYLIDFST